MMYTGKLVFSQVMDYLPLHTFRRYVARYQGERDVKHFRCLDPYLVMAFAQLSYRSCLLPTKNVRCDSRNLKI